MKPSLKKSYPLLVVAAFLLATWCFMQFGYQYHLFRREQTMVFINDTSFFGSYFGRPGWLTSLTGDFMMQFYYYRGAGAVIVALCLGILWLFSFTSAKRLKLPLWAATLSATVVSLWEFLRECSVMYSLSSTLSLILAFVLFTVIAMVKSKWARSVLLVLAMPLCYWLCGYSALILGMLSVIYLLIDKNFIFSGISLLITIYLAGPCIKNTAWWGWPDMAMERKLAIDCEAYFGNWNKVEKLLSDGTETKMEAYYNYLTNAVKGNLPEALRYKMPASSEALLPDINENLGSVDISAYGEAWFWMGDMTIAEHCAILAMISSRRNTGSRYLRRLAEINLINGDEQAALKYLRILSKTACHRSWAMSRMPGNESEAAKSRIDKIKPYLVKNDTIRSINGYVTSLRHLLDSNPGNDIAYDYLLCYQLVNRDLKGFMQDLDPNRPMKRLYQEAVLIDLAINGAKPEDLDKYSIPDKMLGDFDEFNSMLPINDANINEIRYRFGNTYWFTYISATK